jgi:hypothetical protein
MPDDGVLPKFDVPELLVAFRPAGCSALDAVAIVVVFVSEFF